MWLTFEAPTVAGGNFGPHGVQGGGVALSATSAVDDTDFRAMAMMEHNTTSPISLQESLQWLVLSGSPLISMLCPSTSGEA